jgi:ribonuclease Z
MPQLILLGSAASVPDAEHDTVSMVLCGPGWSVLIECGGSPLYKLARLGIGPETIHSVILTHGHADHLYGLPILVQGLWLGGREAALPVYGPGQALDRASQLLALLDLTDSDRRLSLEWHSVPLREEQQVLGVGEIRVTASPVLHGDQDTLALRFDNSLTKRAIVYSADTEPCPTLIRLAAGADLLLHEATGDFPGHSTPAEAAEVAREAGVGQLVLIHYPVQGVKPQAWRRQAAGFPGAVTLAHDGDVYPL